MKTTSLLLLAIASTHALQLSAQEKDDLKAEIEAWKKSRAGQIAASNGLLPIKNESNLESGELEDGPADEEYERFAATKKIVAELNEANPSATFSTNNQFAMMTEEEFAAYVKGAFKSAPPARQLRGGRELTAAQREAAGVDWTTNQCMSDVRNQGQCGSCWSFAAVGAVEFGHCLVTGQRVDFSEQQLVSCAPSAGRGCQGGWPDKALDYIAQTGLCTESAFPYTSGSTEQDGQCQNCQKTKVSTGNAVDISGESALQSALDKQVVTVVVEAGNNVWRNYQSGVVTQCPGAQSDHAVIAVGYGTKDGVQHFKIKNSWGTGWGEQGYIYLQRGRGGKGMCNVAERPSYPELLGSPSQPTSQPQPTGRPTTKPKPTQKPKPTKKPQNACNGCNGCYYPAASQCLSADYDKEYCQYLAPQWGTQWCGA
nr:secreted protein [Achlya hypogyna]